MYLATKYDFVLDRYRRVYKYFFTFSNEIYDDVQPDSKLNLHPNELRKLIFIYDNHKIYFEANLIYQFYNGKTHMLDISMDISNRKQNYHRLTQKLIQIMLDNFHKFETFDDVIEYSIDNQNIFDLYQLNYFYPVYIKYLNPTQVKCFKMFDKFDLLDVDGYRKVIKICEKIFKKFIKMYEDIVESNMK